MSRFSSIINLDRYARSNPPYLAGEPKFTPPKEEQHILRMLVDSPYSGFKLPENLNWTLPIIAAATYFQTHVIGIRHPYMYLTVRHGVVKAQTDDHWHVDGFSVKYNHLPEANYSITSHTGTEWADQLFHFPLDFNPLVHNVHSFFSKRVEDVCIKQLESGKLFFLDPYVVHRRPPETFGMQRTMVRVSLTPIEIPDCNNTVNPLIATPHYVIDGIKNFRNKLINHD